MTVGIQYCPTKAYATTETPNTRVFGQPLDSRVIAGVEWQVCAYWAADDANQFLSFSRKKLVIGKRKLPHGEWSWYVTDPQLSADNGHHTIATGIDADGYVHVWYDMHADPLRYRKSTAPIASWTGELTAELSMLGTNETFVAYPQRFYDPQGKMYFVARMTGGSGDGNYYGMSYSEATQTWAAMAGTGSGGKILDGTSTTPDYSGYLFDVPRFSSDWDGAGTGYLHITWSWRLDTSLSNIDVCHVRWNGTTWSQWDGTAQTMPITKSTSRVVLSAPASEGIFNQSGSCLDANNRPHVSVIKSDGTRHQLYDLYFTGSAWTLQQITSYAGTSTYADFGRPAVECDPDTNEVFIWGTHTAEAAGIHQWKSGAGDFSTWSRTAFFSGSVGIHEPQIDVRLWQRDRLVSMFVVRGRNVSAGDETARIVTRSPKGRGGAFSKPTWGRKHPIEIDATKVGAGGVTGYTLRLTRTNLADEVCDPSSANKAQKDGGDLRFFLDAELTQRLACEVLAFDWDSAAGADDADVLINVGPVDLSSSTDTTLWVAYSADSTVRQPFVDEPYGALATRDANWKLDMPLNRHVGRADVLDDQVESWSEQKIIPIGKTGATFDGASQLGLEKRVRGIGAGFAIAALVTDTTSASSVGQIVAADDSGTNRALHFRTDTTGQPRFLRLNSSNVVASNFVGPTSIRGAQKRFVVEYDGSGSRIYIDGAQVASDAVATAQHDDANLIWHIGGRYYAATIEYRDRFVGNIRALEWHAPRSAAWWATDANNMMAPQTFAIVGAAMDATPAPPTINSITASLITSSGVRITLGLTR